MNNHFYITTPIYYINDRPHLGTAYSTVIADILTRYHKLFGYKTFFLTGTDEHGQKCEQAAKQKGLLPAKHAALMRENFKKTWDLLNIAYTPIGTQDGSFFYTSHKYPKGYNLMDHTKTVQMLLQKLKDQGDIYLGTYKGWYCVSEEIFYTEKEIVQGKSPTGKELIPLEEKAWFFKMSKYQDFLKDHLDKNPHFIKPKERQNEIKAFLKNPLKDLCISRPKNRVSWGIELPFDTKGIVYVWVDALCNYITGLGYGSQLKKDKACFKNYWEDAGAIHLIGKDILITHAIYWPCLLKALSLSLPKMIFAHGWLLNKSAGKMSKSQGDKLEPLELSKTLSVDGLRYFLAKDIVLGKDSAVSKQLMIKRVNEDLADNLGNILSRVSRLIEKHFKGQVPGPVFKEIQPLLEKTKPLKPEAQLNPTQLLEANPESQLSHTQSLEGNPESTNSLVDLKHLTEITVSRFETQIKNFELSQALQDVFSLLVELNKYLEQTAPWKLVKQDKQTTGFVLYQALEVLRICALLLHPVMPQKMTELLSLLGEEPDNKPDLPNLQKDTWEPNFKKVKWGSFTFPKPIKHSKPLFPKIKIEG